MDAIGPEFDSFVPPLGVAAAGAETAVAAEEDGLLGARFFLATVVPEAAVLGVVGVGATLGAGERGPGATFADNGRGEAPETTFPEVGNFETTGVTERE